MASGITLREQTLKATLDEGLLMKIVRKLLDGDSSCSNWFASGQGKVVPNISPLVIKVVSPLFRT